ncbi:MAG: hypothetical protein H7833_02765 [Magnetococcus sp. DMHC-1]
MTEQDQKQLGKTLWAIADQLHGAMNADDFRMFKTHKKGLMQKLFPALDETSA